MQSKLTFSQQQKLAQTGMKFLNVSLDARASAFGDAVTSLETNSSAMFYNPAAMARLEGIADVTLGSTQFIADINYYNAAIAFAPFNGDYGIFGLSFVSVDYGEFLGTLEPITNRDFWMLELSVQLQSHLVSVMQNLYLKNFLLVVMLNM